MTKPTKWDLKTWLTLAAFFGVGSFGTLLSQAQRITGWLAGPYIEQTQSRGLDSLRAWHRTDLEAHAAQAAATKALSDKVDTIASRQRFLTDVVSSTADGKAAARRIRAKQKESQERESLFGDRRIIADERTTYRGYKGEP